MCNRVRLSSRLKKIDLVSHTVRRIDKYWSGQELPDGWGSFIVPPDANSRNKNKDFKANFQIRQKNILHT